MKSKHDLIAKNGLSGLRKMNINHLHLTEGLYYAARGQATGVSLLQISECHKKAIRQEA
jgi:hypothetical protein